jgi:hypothetical protein
MSEDARRCPECRGALRVIDARRLLLECSRCGIRISGKRDGEAEEGGRSLDNREGAVRQRKRLICRHILKILNTTRFQDRFSSSGSLAMLAAMRRASSRVISLVAARRPDTSSK